MITIVLVALLEWDPADREKRRKKKDNSVKCMTGGKALHVNINEWMITYMLTQCNRKIILFYVLFFFSLCDFTFYVVSFKLSFSLREL